MRWTYRVHAASQPRVLMRIAQLFDQQMVTMQRCVLVETGDRLAIVITVETGEEVAQRIRGKLGKQVDIDEVELEALMVPADVC